MRRRKIKHPRLQTKAPVKMKAFIQTHFQHFQILYDLQTHCPWHLSTNLLPPMPSPRAEMLGGFFLPCFHRISSRYFYLPHFHHPSFTESNYSYINTHFPVPVVWAAPKSKSSWHYPAAFTLPTLPQYPKILLRIYTDYKISVNTAGQNINTLVGWLHNKD